jgi:hypothetical protein
MFCLPRTASKSAVRTVAEIRKVSLRGQCGNLGRIQSIFPRISVLFIDDAPSLTMPSFHSLKDPIFLTKIRIFNIASFHFSTSDTCSRQFPTVLSLDIVRVGGVGESIFNFISLFPQVNYLHLSDCFSLTDRQVHLLTSTLIHLKELFLDCCVQLSAVRMSAAAAHLFTLRISNCPTVRSLRAEVSVMSIALNGAGVNDDCIGTLVRSCPNLLTLDLSQCNSLLDLEVNSISLTSICLKGCVRLKSVSVQCLEMRLLVLSHCESLIQCTVHCENLSKLDLKMLRSLKCVDLKCPRLTHLDLSGCGKLRYIGRYLSEADDYRNISLSNLYAYCPHLTFKDGDRLAGTILYEQYVRSISGSEDASG